MSASAVYLALGVAWVLAAAGGGALLALLAGRALPTIPFARLWAFYATLLAVGSAIFLVIGIR